MVELIVNLLLLACGIAIGYFWRKPAPTGVREVVRLEYVDRPVVVKEPELRVEYIDKPVIVEKPTIQIERIDVPHLIETRVVEKAPAPSVASRTPAAPVVHARVVLMDADERKVKATETIDAKLRRGTILRGAEKFQCARQADNGDWIYRQVTH